MPYRIASSLLGFWLMASVFCWHHAPNRGFNDFFVGIALFLSGYCGMYLRNLRWFDFVLGLWTLAMAALMTAEGYPERLHDGLLGLAVVVLACIPGVDADFNHDRWVSEFDMNPRLMRESLTRQSIEG